MIGIESVEQKPRHFLHNLWPARVATRTISLKKIAADVFGAPITHALVADMFAATKAAMQTELLMIMLLMVPTKCKSSMTPASHNAARRGRGSHPTTTSYGELVASLPLRDALAHLAAR